MKLMYLAGPGNIIGTFECWKEGKDDPSQLAITYSGQFYDACTELEAEAYVISVHPGKKIVRQGNFTLENRPVPFSNSSAPLYYLGQIVYAFDLVVTALKFRPDVVIASGGTTALFIFSLLPKFGIDVIATLHCVLWPKYWTLNGVKGFFWKLNSHFFSSTCSSIMSISQDVNEQVYALTKGKAKPIVNFLPIYRENEFDDVLPPDTSDRSTCQVLFVGRVEENKGIFDVLKIAKRFKDENRSGIVFHICGDGSAMERLRSEVEELDLASSFIIHGYCNKEKMRKIMSLSHLFIVPTTSDFIEGFNKVVAEAIMIGRPVITSSVCPALSYVRDAVVEVPVNDVQAYGDAILKLYENHDFYDQMRQNCKQLSQPFYDASRGWKESLKKCLYGKFT